MESNRSIFQYFFLLSFQIKQKKNERMAKWPWDDCLGKHTCQHTHMQHFMPIFMRIFRTDFDGSGIHSVCVCVWICGDLKWGFLLWVSKSYGCHTSDAIKNLNNIYIYRIQCLFVSFLYCTRSFTLFFCAVTFSMAHSFILFWILVNIADAMLNERKRVAQKVLLLAVTGHKHRTLLFIYL